MAPSDDPERQPLLSRQRSTRGHREENDEDVQLVEFSDQDPENPREWSLFDKYTQVLQIFFLALICPMASSMFAPAIDEMAADFGTTNQMILAGQSGFVCMLGIGPLFLAPMSETFGRRIVFVTNLAIFTLLQIPTALAPNVESFIALRVLGGLFGSVGVANGGGSISDIFEARERAPVLGFYLIAPLVG